MFRPFCAAAAARAKLTFSAAKNWPVR
ncbi:hypothetical protein SPHINGO8AM_120042 [Sphingomonas sp. 8AM]|nr:hypothetical protein SPHINGO8AM_120042 [Sphingomonas sp. 8AM]